MTEILTESFCERCGTRYTFEAVEGRRSPLGAIGTFGRGLRHFVSDPGSSLEEALAVARSEKEQRSTTHALEAFHRTFNFCLNCRQYTCGDCWNAVEGRCLTCAPTPDAIPPETRQDTLIPVRPVNLQQPQAPMRIDPMALDTVVPDSRPIDGTPLDGAPLDAASGESAPSAVAPSDAAASDAAPSDAAPSDAAPTD